MNAPPTPETLAANRILIYRLGSLGDTVVALPSFHLIARTFPRAERRLLTNIPVHAKAPLSAAVLEGSGLVHGYLNYPVGLRDLRALLQLRRDIRNFRPDILIYLAPPRGLAAARRDALFFRLCGIKKIIGLPITEDLQRCRWLAPGSAAPSGYVKPDPPRPNLPPDIGLPIDQLLEPEAARLGRCLAPLGDANIENPASWDLCLSTEEQQKAVYELAPVLIHSDPGSHPILAAAIGTKVQAKDWGVDNWRATLTQLAAELPNHRLVLVGAPQEAADSATAASAWTGRTLNLCGQLSPRETAAVLAHAQLFIGLDSGPMHLAAAVATPVVAIFAARNRPVHWFPFGPQHRIVYHKTDCWGCGLETCIAQRKKCLTSITVEEALAAIRQSLAR